MLASSKGIIGGTILILAVYSVLPNEMRFSRAIILLTGFWTLLSTLLVRYALSKINPRAIINNNFIKKIAVVGNTTDADKVKEILNNSSVKYIYVGNVEINEQQSNLYTERIEEFIRVNNVDEIIFCTQNISMRNIVTTMLLLSSLGKEYKIAPHEGSFIIGSNSIETTGELYTLDIKAIGTQASKRNKRLFDLITSFVLIIFAPIVFPFIKHPFKSWANAFKVFIGLKTWIGYSNKLNESVALPKIKPCIFPFNASKGNKSNIDIEENIFYARNYNINLDFKIFLENIFR
jgi:hypothetical protein